MNRTEFIITIAIILFVAFCLGWFANWLVHRFSRVSQSDIGELDRLAQSVHEAEEMRDQIVLACEKCKRKNYRASRNKKLSTEKLALNKFCPRCRSHTVHKEGKV